MDHCLILIPLPLLSRRWRFLRGLVATDPALFESRIKISGKTVYLEPYLNESSQKRSWLTVSGIRGLLVSLFWLSWFLFVPNNSGFLWWQSFCHILNCFEVLSWLWLPKRWALRLNVILLASFSFFRNEIVSSKFWNNVPEKFGRGISRFPVFYILVYPDLGRVMKKIEVEITSGTRLRPWMQLLCKALIADTKSYLDCDWPAN